MAAPVSALDGGGQSASLVISDRPLAIKSFSAARCGDVVAEGAPSGLGFLGLLDIVSGHLCLRVLRGDRKSSSTPARRRQNPSRRAPYSRGNFTKLRLRSLNGIEAASSFELQPASLVMKRISAHPASLPMRTRRDTPRRYCREPFASLRSAGEKLVIRLGAR